MLFLLLILFVFGPIAEIFVLLTAGSAFGVLPVVGACLLTAAVGGWLIRWQGLAALAHARRDLDSGRLPVSSAVNGALLAAAAPFLMTPGFITDAFGFALLIPPFRRFLARQALAAIKRRVERGEAKVTIYRP